MAAHTNRGTGAPLAQVVGGSDGGSSLAENGGRGRGRCDRNRCSACGGDSGTGRHPDEDAAYVTDQWLTTLVEMDTALHDMLALLHHLILTNE